MQAIFTASGADYILAHGPERGIDKHVGPQGESHVQRRGVQEQPRCRAQTEPVPRGLLPTSFGLDVEVEKEDLRLAQLYLVTYPQSVPHVKGTLRLVETAGGGPQQVNILANASIELISVKRSGVRLFIHYDIKGTTWS